MSISDNTLVERVDLSGPAIPKRGSKGWWFEGGSLSFTGPYSGQHPDWEYGVSIGGGFRARDRAMVYESYLYIPGEQDNDQRQDVELSISGHTFTVRVPLNLVPKLHPPFTWQLFTTSTPDPSVTGKARKSVVSNYPVGEENSYPPKARSDLPVPDVSIAP